MIIKNLQHLYLRWLFYLSIQKKQLVDYIYYITLSSAQPSTHVHPLPEVPDKNNKIFSRMNMRQKNVE